MNVLLEIINNVYHSFIIFCYILFKVILEESAEEKQRHIEKLETTIKSLSAELLKVGWNMTLPLCNISLMFRCFVGFFVIYGLFFLIG